MADSLADLSSRGVSIWLDDLSRSRLASGSLASLVARDHVVGVTTNQLRHPCHHKSSSREGERE